MTTSRLISNYLDEQPTMIGKTCKTKRKSCLIDKLLNTLFYNNP